MKHEHLFLKLLNDNMQSCNGGNQKWTLNQKVTSKGPLEMCQNGIHVTLQPHSWKGSRVFIAKVQGIADFWSEGMKAVCRSATLLKELAPKLLKAYEEGEASLLKAYKEKCQKLIAKMLTQDE
jgi:hypothetical protein